MGVCPSLSPQERVVAHKNSKLKMTLQSHLKDLCMYNFAGSLQAKIPEIPVRYLLNEDLIDDIQKIRNRSLMNISLMTQSVSTQIQCLEEDAWNSCIILEDQALAKNQKSDADLLDDNAHSFHANLAKHESLVVQMNIMYKHDFEINEYRNSLKLFLQWSSSFQQNFYGGFLKPVYQQFCNSVYKLPIQELEIIVDQTNVFVQYMVSIYTEIYSLDLISQSANGDLFKNENIFNLIMSLLFQKTKIKRFLRKTIRCQEAKKIEKFTQKLKTLKHKNLQFFGIDPKFNLQHLQLEQKKQNKKECTGSGQADVTESDHMLPTEQPYSQCFRFITQLCEQSALPAISKLKVIVQLSKQIMKSIYWYYDQIEQQCPDLDPDSLNSIIMYLIAKAGKSSLLEQLKIVQYFTTTNCMNSISGFYLSTFLAALETILDL